jgi:hypothetical protein
MVGGRSGGDEFHGFFGEVAAAADLPCEILRARVDRDYQPRGTKPGPKKGTPRQDGMKEGYRFPKK